MSPTRILIADDHEVVRRGLRALFQGQPQWELIGEAKDGTEAVEQASKLDPDIIILDIGMSPLSGFDATQQILKLKPSAKILIFTMHDSEQAIKKAVTAGARGYVRKADAGQDMVRAVHAVLNGQTFFTRKAAEIMLDEFTGNRLKPSGADPQRITRSDYQILQLLAQGKTVKDVAALLNLSAKVVHMSRANLMCRFGCRSVGEIVRYCLRNRLIEA